MPILKSHTGKRILFIHIPKTGGITLEHVFKTQYRWQLLGKDIGIKEYTHLTLTEIINEYPHVFKLAKDFCTIIRHPYDRMVSLYCFWNQASDYRVIYPKIPFDEYILAIQNVLAKHKETPYNQFEICHYLPMTDFITHDGIIPDYLKILRYENYEPELRNFFKDENAPTPQGLMKLPIINSSNRTKEKETFLNDKTKKLIYETYPRDFEVLGYER